MLPFKTPFFRLQHTCRHLTWPIASTRLAYWWSPIFLAHHLFWWFRTTSEIGHKSRQRCDEYWNPILLDMGSHSWNRNFGQKSFPWSEPRILCTAIASRCHGNPTISAGHGDVFQRCLLDKSASWDRWFARLWNIHSSTSQFLASNEGSPPSLVTSFAAIPKFKMDSTSAM